MLPETPVHTHSVTLTENYRLRKTLRMSVTVQTDLEVDVWFLQCGSCIWYILYTTGAIIIPCIRFKYRVCRGH